MNVIDCYYQDEDLHTQFTATIPNYQKHRSKSDQVVVGSVEIPLNKDFVVYYRFAAGKRTSDDDIFSIELITVGSNHENLFVSANGSIVNGNFDAVADLFFRTVAEQEPNCFNWGVKQVLWLENRIDVLDKDILMFDINLIIRDVRVCPYHQEIRDSISSSIRSPGFGNVEFQVEDAKFYASREVVKEYWKFANIYIDYPVPSDICIVDDMTPEEFEKILINCYVQKGKDENSWGAGPVDR